MVSIEQHVEKVEARVDAHQELLVALRNDQGEFRREANARFTQIEGRLVQIDGRFVQIDARFVQADGKLTALDQKMNAGFGRLDRRIDGLDVKFDAGFGRLDQKIDIGLAGLRHDMGLQFRWLVGIMLTGMATIAAAVLAQ